MNEPQRITEQDPPQWAVEAQNEICAALGFNWEGDMSLAAIIAKHAPQPTGWRPASTAPENLDVVLCDYPGVYSLRLGYLRAHRFYPFGEQGSVPFKNWMTIPAIPSPDQPTAPESAPAVPETPSDKEMLDWLENCHASVSVVLAGPDAREFAVSRSDMLRAAVSCRLRSAIAAAMRGEREAT